MSVTIVYEEVQGTAAIGLCCNGSLCSPVELAQQSSKIGSRQEAELKVWRGGVQSRNVAAILFEVTGLPSRDPSMNIGDNWCLHCLLVHARMSETCKQEGGMGGL